MESMETVKHLWNVNQFMTQLKSPLVTELQMFYTQKCKNLSNRVELPQQNFGPSVTCSHCGSLWRKVDHQVRINTELPFKKRSHLKPNKLNNSQTETPQSNRSNRRRKKKKSKDKTAGLNISGCTPVSQLNKKDCSKTPTASPVITPKTIPSDKRLSTSHKKPKKLNIERLKRIMENKTTAPAKRKNLHSFLAELY
ncbi:uncharacterized protein LOC143907274 isoform X2 [Temnothorax americanus]|uniref:uncharacterized protein LOC143907274 isoform X2 n=1 Tax=Temnothorax americanus TaxID=1964332 RepID=UPI0040677B19